MAKVAPNRDDYQGMIEPSQLMNCPEFSIVIPSIFFTSPAMHVSISSSNFQLLILVETNPGFIEITAIFTPALLNSWLSVTVWALSAALAMRYANNLPAFPSEVITDQHVTKIVAFRNILVIDPFFEDMLMIKPNLLLFSAGRKYFEVKNGP